MSGVRAIVLRRLADAGFSLLELMAAVAILALLAAVATPLYTRYGVRAQGAAARADLMRCAQGMERHASWTFSYLAPSVRTRREAVALISARSPRTSVPRPPPATS